MRNFYEENNQATPAIKFEEVQPAGYSLITDPIQLENLHAERYEINREAGVDYYNHFQAKLYIKITTGVYTVAQVVTLEAYLKNLGDEIKAGSWLTAQNNIGGLALSGIFDQDMKDEIKGDIDLYVLENY